MGSWGSCQGVYCVYGDLKLKDRKAKQWTKPVGESAYLAGASAWLEYERDVGFYYSRRVTIYESKSSFDGGL